MLPVQRVAIVTMEHSAESVDADPLLNERGCASATQRNKLEAVTVLDMSDNNVQAQITPGDDRVDMAKITPNDETEGLNPLLIDEVCASAPGCETPRTTVMVSSEVDSRAQSMQGYEKKACRHRH